ncbi:MAG: hypothetical protein IPP14_04645 [Planctomycetes bacterium]|nr:hypothetical protein [Planctomycetota bacterium]
MNRTLTLALIAVLLSVAAHGQEPRVVKESPDGKNEIAPGDTFEANAAAIDATDSVTLVCESDVICNLEITVPEGGQVYLMADPYTVFSEVGVNLKLTRARFKKGRNEIRMRPNRAGDYKLIVTVWAELPDFDIEPNNDTTSAQALAAGQKMRGTVSMPYGDRDCYTAQVEAGPLHVVFKKLVQADKDRPLNARFSIMAKGPEGYIDDQYAYAADETTNEYHFYPVVKAGPVWFYLLMGSTVQGDEYEISWEPFTPGLTDADKQAARKALETGEKWLVDQGPGGKTWEPYEAAMDAFAFMALLAGEAGKNDRKTLEQTWVPRLEASLKLVPDIEWKGEAVYGIEYKVYEHSIVTLALAEAVAQGLESAKPACLKAARFLLAAQLTGSRHKDWNGPVATSDDSFGGWRYTPNSKDMDISVTGWCLVALTAVDAAGLKVEGLRDSVAWALKAIRHCTDDFGFTYVPKSSGNGNIRNSIGALVLLLYGESGSAFNIAIADIDAHFPAGTQVDDGHNSPLYYAYYATRADYLRSGKVWEAWRTAMLRQLVRLQEPGGSWRPMRAEAELERRFATALSLMILRMCLNEVPKYLKHEAEGF